MATLISISAADTHDIPYTSSTCRSIMYAVQDQMYPMHPLYSTLPVPYVRVRVTLADLVAQLYTYAPRRCWTLQYCRTFIALAVSLWNGLDDPVFDGVGLAGFKSRANAFLLA